MGRTHTLALLVAALIGPGGCSGQVSGGPADQALQPRADLRGPDADAAAAPDAPDAASDLGADAHVGPGLTTVELTLVDGASSTYYATFQSHNQKVLASAGGIFMTYLHSCDDSGGDAQTKAEWRLARSVDGGKSFTTIYGGVHATKAPAIETDPAGNLYLVHPDWKTGHATLYRFDAAKGYAGPKSWQITNGSAGKYALLYDTKRGRLVYLTWSHLFILSTSGQLISSTQMFTKGPHAYVQYPHLTRSPDATDTLFAAWTTTAVGDAHYYDVHFVASWDGGGSWGLPLPGQMVSLPLIPDDTGPAVPIVLPSQISATQERSNWLANAFYKDWKLHFMYSGPQGGAYSTTYARYDWNNTSPRVDIRVTPQLKGQQLALQSLDGFFTSDLVVGSRIFLVSRTTTGLIGVLASEDNGASWYDYAVSSGYTPPAGTAIYAIGGSRLLSPQAAILGSFTEQHTQGGAHRVYFLRARGDVQRPGGP